MRSVLTLRSLCLPCYTGYIVKIKKKHIYLLILQLYPRYPNLDVSHKVHCLHEFYSKSPIFFLICSLPHCVLILRRRNQKKKKPTTITFKVTRSTPVQTNENIKYLMSSSGNRSHNLRHHWLCIVKYILNILILYQSQ